MDKMYTKPKPLLIQLGMNVRNMSKMGFNIFVFGKNRK